MTHPNIVDAASALTDADVSILGPIVDAFTYLQFRVIVKRGAICHWPSGEVAFITRRDPVHVRRLADGWNDHFRRLAEKAGER